MNGRRLAVILELIRVKITNWQLNFPTLPALAATFDKMQ